MEVRMGHGELKEHELVVSPGCDTSNWTERNGADVELVRLEGGPLVSFPPNIAHQPTTRTPQPKSQSSFDPRHWTLIYVNPISFATTTAHHQTWSLSIPPDDGSWCQQYPRRSTRFSAPGERSDVPFCGHSRCMERRWNSPVFSTVGGLFALFPQNFDMIFWAISLTKPAQNAEPSTLNPGHRVQTLPKIHQKIHPPVVKHAAAVVPPQQRPGAAGTVASSSALKTWSSYPRSLTAGSPEKGTPWKLEEEKGIRRVSGTT